MTRKYVFCALSLLGCASQSAPPAETAPTETAPHAQASSESAENTEVPPEEAGGLGLSGTSAPERRIGSLPKESIRSTIQAAHPQIETCYHTAREATPTLSGTLKLRFIINEKGGVESPQVHSESTITDRAMQRCMLDLFASLKFPEPTNGIVIVNYPFVFEYEDIRAKKAK
jgi:outer membrane biosynthesis protein TonB